MTDPGSLDQDRVRMNTAAMSMTGALAGARCGVSALPLPWPHRMSRPGRVRRLAVVAASTARTSADADG